MSTSAPVCARNVLDHTIPTTKLNVHPCGKFTYPPAPFPSGHAPIGFVLWLFEAANGEKEAEMKAQSAFEGTGCVSAGDSILSDDDGDGGDDGDFIEDGTRSSRVVK